MISKHNQRDCLIFYLVINMPLNKESTLVKKMFSNQLSLMNGHHSTAVVMYKCAKRDQIVIGAGVKVKKRLEYLLENDIELRTAIQEDEDDMNRARSRRYVDVVPAQAYGRSPIIIYST